MTHKSNNNMKQEEAENKHQRALAKARARGDAATEWFKTNKLTAATQPEFNKLMKQVDKSFDKK